MGAMSITVLTGPAGSGKSHLLVEAVKKALAEERNVSTFMAKDAMVRSHDPNTWCHGVIASREAGFHTPLDHLVTAPRSLRELKSGRLHAHFFHHQNRLRERGTVANGSKAAMALRLTNAQP